MDAKHTQTLDPATLSQFTGTAQYWRVARQFVITDGVKYLAETAACFWLIDGAISHLLEIGTRFHEDSEMFTKKTSKKSHGHPKSSSVLTQAAPHPAKMQRSAPHENGHVDVPQPLLFGSTL